MTKPGWLNRRRFVQMAGMAALGTRPQWLRGAVEPDRQVGPRLAFIGAMGQAHGIHVYAIEGEQWRLLQFVSSPAPVSLVIHPSSEFLYVLNEVCEYQGLPCSTVEAYSLNSKTGQLTLLGIQPLALSATLPRHLAVSPDGNKLIVAVHGGGAYNMLPILSDGRVGRLCGIRKETGDGPVAEHQKTAHPQTVLFDTTGMRVITADLGCDRLSVFSTADGFEIQASYEMPAGCGPRHLALHPSGEVLYVDHALNGSISALRYDAREGRITELLMRAQGGFGEALAMHPTGNFLYSAGKGEVTAWRVEVATAALQKMQSQYVETDEVRGLSLLADGSAISVLTSNGVLRLDIGANSGYLGNPVLVASVPQVRSIAI